MRLLYAIFLSMFICTVLFAQSVEIKNASFESGLENWGARYPERTYTKSPISVKGRKGRKAACVNATNPRATVILFQTVKLEKGRYEFTGSYKVDKKVRRDRSSAPECVRVFAARARPLLGNDITYNYTIVGGKDLPNGWVSRTVRFTLNKPHKRFRVGLQVAGVRGKVWFDDASLERIPPKPLPNDGLWFEDATWLDDGLVTRQRLFDMQANKSPFIDRAKKYNDALVDAALLEDELYRLDTAAGYLGEKPDAELHVDMKEILSDMDKANRTFTRLYIDKKPESLVSDVDPLLAKIESAIISLKGRVETALEKRMARVNLKKVKPAPEGPYRISPDGTPNQIMFGNWGKFQWMSLSRKLGVWRFGSHCAKTKETRSDGTLDWSVALRSYDGLKKLGVDYYGLSTWIFSHENTVVPPAFMKKHRSDPDVWNPKRLKKPSQPTRPLNQWNPKVREMQRDMVRDMARTVKGKGIMFYHYAWENRGPHYMPYNPKTPPAKASGLKLFRAFLKKRHSTIAALNRAWKTNYTSFEKIVPPAKRAKRPNADPLGYEYHLWRHETHMDNMRSIYKAWKSEDPDTPVMVAHSQFFSQVDPTRVFETADVLENHNRWANCIVSSLYLADNAPLHNKKLWMFENWNPLQDDTGLFGDERAMFAQNAKCAYRYGFWGMHLSFWAFPYTSQSSWMWRQGQWAKLNSDYCLMRWSAAGMPVAKRRVKRMEKVLMSLTKAPSKVLLVYPRTSWLHAPSGRSVRHQTEPMVRLMHASGRPFDFRNENRINSGLDKLSDYKAIILPWAPYLPDGLGEKLLAWTREGGLLICFGPAGVYDKYGFPDGRLMKNTLGLVPRATGDLSKDYMGWDFGSQKPNKGVIDKRCGKGRLLLTTETLRRLLEISGTAKKLLGVLNEAAPPPVGVKGGQLEVYPLRDKKGRSFIGLVNAEVAAVAHSTLTIPGDYTKVFDLDYPDGFPVPAKRIGNALQFNVKLGPGQMMLLKLASARRLTR